MLVDECHILIPNRTIKGAFPSSNQGSLLAELGRLHMFPKAAIRTAKRTLMSSSAQVHCIAGGSCVLKVLDHQLRRLNPVVFIDC